MRSHLERSSSVEKRLVVDEDDDKRPKRARSCERKARARGDWWHEIESDNKRLDLARFMDNLHDKSLVKITSMSLLVVCCAMV